MTPMMKQYMLLKEQYSDCLLFYRLGDFYEMFFEDAITASRELEIVLTGRDCGMDERAPMCGVPFHAVTGYVSALIQKGYKVAICEQMTDPAETKGLVERDVVRVITPGTVMEDNMLTDSKNNYILSIFVTGDSVGICAADVTTGAFELDERSGKNWTGQMFDEIARIQPSEIICNSAALAFLENKTPVKPSEFFNYAYTYETSVDELLRHFKVSTLDGYGVADYINGVIAGGALIKYLTYTQKNSLEHINRITTYQYGHFMTLDGVTRRNLELTVPLRGGGKKGTLFWLLDETKTAVGARALRSAIEQPLQDAREINERLDAVSELLDNMLLRENLRELLDGIYDVERLVGKLSYGTINARDCLALGKSLALLPEIKNTLKGSKSRVLAELSNNMVTLEDVAELLSNAVADDPPVGVKDGGIIKDGYNEQIDAYRKSSIEGKQWVAELETKEREATGIKNLKVSFNRVFGYYIEVTRSYYNLVPYRYIRKQTLANSERFVTPELKEMEENIVGADDKCVKLEYQVFQEIRETLMTRLTELQTAAKQLARIDMLCALSQVAYQQNYRRPLINTEGRLELVKGRHPVVEKAQKEPFVPNDARLNSGGDRILIITGPNMAGKSTYMRQIALITLMAHIGSFVPCESADICVVDRIFTRVGASDDLSSGQSTFMVEMAEMANILNNATADSLLILDEIGRGTGTLDGLSIAWAAVEYIADQTKIGAKTLFATHYHELSELENIIQGVKNYRILVKEFGDDVVFLRKIIPGGTDKSFGIQVAKLAGVPLPVIARAKELLIELQDADIAAKPRPTDEAAPAVNQLTLFDDRQPSQVESAIRQLNVDELTPIQAMNMLNELKEMVMDA